MPQLRRNIWGAKGQLVQVPLVLCIVDLERLSPRPIKTHGSSGWLEPSFKSERIAPSDFNLSSVPAGGRIPGLIGQTLQ